MRRATGSFWSALNSGSPIVVVYYPELETRQALLEQARAMLPAGRPARQSSDVDDAFQKELFDTPLLLTPADEAAAVLALDGRREMLQDRRAPVVVFLLRGGSASRALQEAPALASWIRESQVDPEQMERIDPLAEAERFHQETGMSPAQWIADWRAGCLPDTLDNNHWLHRAMLLAGEG
jgi:hypothetical protein